MVFAMSLLSETVTFAELSAVLQLWAKKFIFDSIDTPRYLPTRVTCITSPPTETGITVSILFLVSITTSVLAKAKAKG